MGWKWRHGGQRLEPVATGLWTRPAPVPSRGTATTAQWLRVGQGSGDCGSGGFPRSSSSRSPTRSTTSSTLPTRRGSSSHPPAPSHPTPPGRPVSGWETGLGVPTPRRKRSEYPMVMVVAATPFGGTLHLSGRKGTWVTPFCMARFRPVLMVHASLVCRGHSPRDKTPCHEQGHTAHTRHTEPTVDINRYMAGCAHKGWGETFSAHRTTRPPTLEAQGSPTDAVGTGVV